MYPNKNRAHSRPNKVPMVEKVRQYYLTANTDNPVVLTELEEEYRQRMVSCWSLLCNYHSDEQARRIHAKNYGLKDRTAYRDVQNALYVFGEVSRTDKEGRRQQMYEWCVRALQMAKDQGDVKSMNRALENMMRLTGADQPDGDSPDFERLAPSLVVTALPQGIEDAILSMLKGGSINLNKIPEAETIAYEEAESEPRTGTAKAD